MQVWVRPLVSRGTLVAPASTWLLGGRAQGAGRASRSFIGHLPSIGHYRRRGRDAKGRTQQRDHSPALTRPNLISPVAPGSSSLNALTSVYPQQHRPAHSLSLCGSPPPPFHAPSPPRRGRAPRVGDNQGPGGCFFPPPQRLMCHRFNCCAQDTPSKTQGAYVPNYRGNGPYLRPWGPGGGGGGACLNQATA